jgi:SAM-dependent methyltransferase
VKPFRDHFSPLATAYAAFRPHYPTELYDWLTAECHARERAWDCACGSGQATVALAERFAHVIATDASAAQVAAAPSHPRITYGVALAEASALTSESVDLIAVAQALHWFDAERFYGEAHRVAKPGALLAVWSYGALRVDDAAIEALVQSFHVETLGPYWPPERRHVDCGYRTLSFPAREIRTPPFSMRMRWSLPQLLGMLQSWSAVAVYRKARGEDPIPELTRSLAGLWGEPAREREITWPLTVRAARLRPK